MVETTYLDHNASTPMDDRVLEAMMPYLQTQFGNASSVHRYGRRAKDALELAREQVASLVGAHPSQVIFTSGGTEANNLAIKGLVTKGNKDLQYSSSAIEHASILQPLRVMQEMGYPCRIVDTDTQGRVEITQLLQDLTPSTLVSVMMANNETGVVQDIETIAQAVRNCGAVMHSDAVQAAGRLPIDFEHSALQMLSLSAHKIYGPKGAGALVVDKALSLMPLLHGGGHEKGRRAGTENVAAIAGFGMAAELALQEREQRNGHLLKLRQRLEQALQAAHPEAVIFSQQAERLANTVCFAIPGLQGETLLLAMDEAGFAISSGSACESKSSEPSHVLMAMAVDEELAHGAVRVSFGKDNTVEQVDRFIDNLSAQVKQLGSLACAW